MNVSCKHKWTTVSEIGVNGSTLYAQERCVRCGANRGITYRTKGFRHAKRKAKRKN